MGLSGFAVERYRCFVDPTAVEVRPITLLFGRNSAGKSALARLLPLLRDSTSPSNGSPLALASTAARGASYSDIASRYSARNALVTALNWDDQEHAVSEVEFQFRDLPEQGRHIVEQVRANIAGKPLLLRFSPQRTEDRYDVHWGSRQTQIALRFSGVLPRPPRKPQWAVEPILLLRSRMAAFAGQIHWLTAVRAPIPRHSKPSAARTLGPAGEGVDSVLTTDWLGKRRLIKRINETYRSMFQHDLRIETTVEGASIVQTPSEGAPISVALADGGEGASQVLPVLALCALAEQGGLGQAPVLILEQPEMHLHPSAERELASLLCAVARRGVRLLVETHSENLVLFTQLAIAKQQLTPEDVRMYYLRSIPGGLGSAVDHIVLNAVGRPHGWPSGVFSEDVAIARELFLAQSQRQSTDEDRD